MKLSESRDVAGRPWRPATLALRLLCALLLLVGAATFAAPAAGANPSPSFVQSQEWWIPTLGLKQVWQISKGAGVTVAVVDSGVDADYSDLRGAVLPGIGSDQGRADPDPAKHGTRMAANIAGRGTGFGLLGVAPEAKILPVGIGDLGNASFFTQAINQLNALPHPPQVVNMSVGQRSPCPSDLQAAITAAVHKGMIIVASAGNDGTTGNSSQTPANCAGVVAVGAFGLQNGSPVAWPGSERQPYVDLSAPGQHIIGFDTQAASGYGYADGTSDAAAIVSGSFALLRAKFPTMSSRQLVARMLYTARQFQGAQGSHNSVWGYGAARPHHALTDTVPANAPNPIYDELAKISGPSGSPSRQDSSASKVNPPPSATASRSAAAAASSGSGGSSTGLIIVIVVVAVLLIAGIVVALLVRQRRRSRVATPGPYGGGAAPPWQQ